MDQKNAERYAFIREMFVRADNTNLFLLTPHENAFAAAVEELNLVKEVGFVGIPAETFDTIIDLAIEKYNAAQAAAA